MQCHFPGVSGPLPKEIQERPQLELSIAESISYRILGGEKF